jgi:hypothetical protein
MKNHKTLFGPTTMALRFLLFSSLQLTLLAQVSAPDVIENPENPRYSRKDAPELLFKQELSIPLEGRRYSFDVDDAGRIYLLDTRAANIAVYDKSGKKVIAFGKKGQGPGELELRRHSYELRWPTGNPAKRRANRWDEQAFSQAQVHESPSLQRVRRRMVPWGTSPI